MPNSPSKSKDKLIPVPSKKATDLVTVPLSPRRPYCSKWADEASEMGLAFVEKVEQDAANPKTSFWQSLKNLCCFFPAGCAKLSAECGCLACVGSVAGSYKDLTSSSKDGKATAARPHK